MTTPPSGNVLIQSFHSLFGDEMHRAVLSRTIMLFLPFLVFGLAAFSIIRLGFAVFIRRLLNIPVSYPSRKCVITSTVILVLFPVIFAYAILVEPNWVCTSHVSVRSSELAKRSSFVIAQISDVHTDVDSCERMKRAIAILRRSRPDVIVLTGDYANTWKPDMERELSAFAKALVSIAPTYAVYGNWDCIDQADVLESAGVRVLQNEASSISVGRNRVKLVGMDFPRKDLLPQMLDKGSKTMQIVLSHTPGMFEASAGLGADLYLCGHTHGGQVRLPLFGTLCTSYVLIGKYQAGCYKNADTTMYVNRGLGLEGGSLGIRFCCRPEVALIRVSGK